MIIYIVLYSVIFIRILACFVDVPKGDIITKVIPLEEVDCLDPDTEVAYVKNENGKAYAYIKLGKKTILRRSLSKVFFTVGIVLSVIGLLATLIVFLFFGKGVETYAVVTDIRNNRDGGREYYLQFESGWSVERTVMTGAPRGTKVGDALKIYYMPGDKAIVSFEPVFPAGGTILSAFIGVVLVLLAIYLRGGDDYAFIETVPLGERIENRKKKIRDYFK